MNAEEQNLLLAAELGISTDQLNKVKAALERVGSLPVRPHVVLPIEQYDGFKKQESDNLIREQELKTYYDQLCRSIKAIREIAESYYRVDYGRRRIEEILEDNGIELIQTNLVTGPKLNFL